MLDLGCHAALEYLGIHARALGYVERDAYAAACLVARMEEESMEPAPVWAGDLESCDIGRLHGLVDIGIAGFPCPPVSAAGQRKGLDDERWILPAILEMFRTAGAGLLFLENVGGLLSANAGREFGEVHRLLAKFGYDAEWLTLRASDVGANHERNRVFILAFRPDRGFRILRESPGRGQLPMPRRGSEGRDGAGSAKQTMGDTDSGRCKQRDAEIRMPEIVGSGHASVADSELSSPARQRRHSGEGLPESGEHCQDRDQLADTGSAGPQRKPGGADTPGREIQTRPTRPSRRELFAPGPANSRWADIIAECPHLAPAVESGLRVFPDGLAMVVDEARADQLRVAGNGVVALQATAAFVTLARRLM